jgi:hypothetical protein
MNFEQRTSKVLVRKVPERERCWQLAWESAVYSVNDEPWPITAAEQVSAFLTPET